jgi:hypothetical protein
MYGYKKEGHIIDNVPYVSQENSSFCSYACSTMIFKHFDIDIALFDFLFNSGVGYSLTYSYPGIKYYLLGGTLLSQWALDRIFVSNLYGLKYESWHPDKSLDMNEKWQKYWKKLKEYIRNDIPISTSIDLSILPSLRELINKYSWVDTLKVPDYFWNIVSTAHEIVIVGFDEEKELVYFNDPAASIIGKPNKNKGIYDSIPIDIFAKAISRAELGDFSPKFLINTYYKNKKSSSKEEIFKKSHERNIRKMKGDIESYDNFWIQYPLGLNALLSIKEDFELITNKEKFDLVYFYRVNSFKINMIKKLCLFFIKKENLPYFDIFDNFYDTITNEKKYILKYLENKRNDFEYLKIEIECFNREKKIWDKISKNYLNFYKQIPLSKKALSEIILKNYLLPIKDIINKEKEIINNFRKFP